VSGDISLKPGETSNQHVAWFQPELGTYQTSALIHDDYFYTLLDRGFLLCHEARTGKQVYGRQRLSTESSGLAASPWAYNGKIFALSEDGDTFVIQAGPKFKLLGKNALNEMMLATPAIARGSLIIRTQSKLYDHKGSTEVTCRCTLRSSGSLQDSVSTQRQALAAEMFEGRRCV
jgi:hypothetical protein